MDPAVLKQKSQDFVVECIDKLKNEGIAAIKYHYSEMKSRPCTITLSPDMRLITWDYHDSNIFQTHQCQIADIENLVFGPNTQTFRSYRSMHLLSIHLGRDQSVEFYGWECISLKLAQRTIDFVIKDKQQMLCFIQALEIVMQMNRNVSSYNAQFTILPRQLCKDTF
jgi:hypothetical protein